MPEYPLTPPRQPMPSQEDSGSIGIQSFELVRRYFEELTSNSAIGNGGTSVRTAAIDWDVVRESIAGSESIEEAIGRAIVVADLMSRGEYKGGRPASDQFFAFDHADATPNFGEKTRFRTWIAERAAAHKALASMGICIVMILSALTASLATHHAGNVPAPLKSQPTSAVNGNAQFQLAAVSLSNGTGSIPISVTPTTVLPAATTPPAPAPPSLASAPPLRPHEVFGFAPYWTLDDSSGFDVSRISTFDYFSIPVNANGSLMESGPGWNGFQSAALASLITRAHAANDRVVLTVNSFDQNTLNQLTSSPTAPSTLATALLGLLREKNLDGVNLDFEGTGSDDQSGLTNLVTQVSTAIHQANPHYQVTMDTYASSGGDPNGFYNIRSLAPAVDAFFVMQYQMNLQSGGSATSPLTSTMLSDNDTIDQYLADVPPSKVILGLPYFGVDWPTSNGTLSAEATGPATQLADAQVMASGHPIYWDTTTDTAWTSYQVGPQWHETFFEDPTSLYDATRLASAANLAGVGIWALGMDGNNPAMLSALLGGAAPLKEAGVGPSTTSESPSSSSTSTSSTSTSSTIPTFSATGGVPGSSSTTTAPTSTSTTWVPISTTTTTSDAMPVSPANYEFSGTWDNQKVTLTPISPDSTIGPSTPDGTLTRFSTNDPQFFCLSSNATLNVLKIDGSSDEYYVEATQSDDCADAYFVFDAS